MSSPSATAEAEDEVFTMDFAALAREIAQDVLEVPQIIRLHRLTDEEWTRIQAHPKFREILSAMIADWNMAKTTPERVRVKAASGLESKLGVFINSLDNESIPLSQRVEAGRFLAKLGSLGESDAAGGSAFQITLNIGHVRKEIEVTPRKTIDLEPVLPENER